MRKHNPKGNKIPSLEKNILKYRAFEMLLILFYAQNIKDLVLGAIQSTDKNRIPIHAKRKYEKAWKALVEDGVITGKESADIQTLLDYRNYIGHEIQKLTFDLNRSGIADDIKSIQGIHYDYTARKKLKRLCEDLPEKMSGKYIFPMSFDLLLFEDAEKTYEDELIRLDRKIRKQLDRRHVELHALRKELSGSQNPEFHPAFTQNKRKNGVLTKRGIEILYRYFDKGKSPLAVSYLMRTSYRTALKYYDSWKGNGGAKRKKEPLDRLMNYGTSKKKSL